MKEGDITSATSIAQEEKVPLQANFTDENLDINTEKLNEPLEVIHEPVKIIPGDYTLHACVESRPLDARREIT